MKAAFHEHKWSTITKDGCMPAWPATVLLPIAAAAANAPKELVRVGFHCFCYLQE
jgi:hypothetical protein